MSFLFLLPIYFAPKKLTVQIIIPVLPLLKTPAAKQCNNESNTVKNFPLNSSSKLMVNVPANSMQTLVQY